MNELMFGFGRHAPLMDAAGGAGGEGGGGGGAGAGGAGGGSAGGGAAGGAGAGAGGGTGGEGGAGGQGGGALSDAGGQGGQGGQGGEGGGQGGALSNAGKNGLTADGGIDWEKISDADYFAQVKVPQIEGAQFNVEVAAKKYGRFCVENHIAPEVIGKFLELEGKAFAESDKAARAEAEKQSAEALKNFNAQGVELRKEFTADQLTNAAEVLGREFGQDKDFMKFATRELSNNRTLVKLLLNWREHHQTDGGTGLGNGAGGTGTLGFAERWTGKKV